MDRDNTYDATSRPSFIKKLLGKIKTAAIIVLLILLVIIAVVWFLRPSSSEGVATIAVVTVVPVRQTTPPTITTPIATAAPPTPTPVLGLSDFGKVAGFDYWTTLQKVEGDIQVEHLKPSVSSSCAIHVSGTKTKPGLITGFQCTAKDSEGNTWIVPWPGWVDSCKVVRYITPLVTEPITLTVDVKEKSIMNVVPGRADRVECVIAGTGYQAGDPFPVPGRVPYVIDASSPDGENGWIIGSDSFFPTRKIGWVYVQNGTLGEYKELTSQGQIPWGGGWWVWDNTLYITLANFQHVCVDLSSDEPVEKPCVP